jgi:hypothetical protein
VYAAGTSKKVGRKTSTVIIEKVLCDSSHKGFDVVARLVSPAARGEKEGWNPSPKVPAKRWGVTERAGPISTRQRDSNK